MERLVDSIRGLGPAHLGEVNLLLNFITDVPRAHDIIVKAVFGYSGATDQIPQPELDINIALSLGLATESDSGLCITKLGRDVLEEAKGNVDRFTPTQLQLLLPEVLGHPELRQLIVSALEYFEKIPDTLSYRIKNMPVNPADFLGLQILQACQVTRYDIGFTIMDSNKYDLVTEILGPSWAITDEDLWKSLEAAKKRAKASEEYVVQFEKTRLIEEGHPDLAHLVKRVSIANARSPYDVLSYNLDASPKYIEVKSSVSNKIIFYWTESERRFAIVNGQSYSIYFVPRCQDLPNLRAPLIIIPDPVKLLGTVLKEESIAYRLTTTNECFTSEYVAGIHVNSLIPRPAFIR